MVEKGKNLSKEQKQIVKWFSIVAVVMAVMIVAGIAGNKSIQEKLDDAMLKCQASVLMSGSDDEEIYDNYEQVKKDCDNILKINNGGDEKKFIEWSDKEFDSYSGEIAGHDKEWYLERVKENQ